MSNVEELTNAVKALNTSVVALRTFVEREYPKRKEVEDTYATKKEARARRNSFILLSIVGLIGSFIVTVSTLTTCFLDEDSNPPAACNLIPDYTEATERDDTLIAEFRRIQSDLARHERELNRLQDQP